MNDEPIYYVLTVECYGYLLDEMRDYLEWLIENNELLPHEVKAVAKPCTNTYLLIGNPGAEQGIDKRLRELLDPSYSSWTVARTTSQPKVRLGGFKLSWKGKPRPTLTTPSAHTQGA